MPYDLEAAPKRHSSARFGANEGVVKEPKGSLERRRTMKETTNAGKMGYLQTFLGTLEANAQELPHVEAWRLKLGVLVGQLREADQRQSALKASRQEASREVERLLSEALRLATVLRLAVKEHYGVRAEKVSEFGIQPFRGRSRKGKAEEPTL
jgi:hypothetical protein